MQAANEAIEEDGVPLTKFFVWSLMDNWEWVCPPCLAPVMPRVLGCPLSEI
jgi:hypothetical protein